MQAFTRPIHPFFVRSAGDRRRRAHAQGRTFRRLCDRAYIGFTTASILLVAGGAHAQGTSTTDVGAPLDQLKQARTKAENSALDAESAKSGATKVVDVLIYGAAALGLALALLSAYKLYKAAQEGEQSRESTGKSIAGLILGSLITVIAIVVGVVVNYAAGDQG